MSFDLQRVFEGKKALRQQRAALPIAEKLRMLDAMRERALTLRNAALRRSARVQELPPSENR